MDTDNIKVNTCTIVNPMDVFLQYKCLPINPYAEISCQHDVTSQYTALNTVTSILREEEPKALSLYCILQVQAVFGYRFPTTLD